MINSFFLAGNMGHVVAAVLCACPALNWTNARTQGRVPWPGRAAPGRICPQQQQPHPWGSAHTTTTTTAHYTITSRYSLDVTYVQYPSPQLVFFPLANLGFTRKTAVSEKTQVDIWPENIPKLLKLKVNISLVFTLTHLWRFWPLIKNKTLTLSDCNFSIEGYNWNFPARF